MQCRQTASPRKRLCAPVLFWLIVCLSLALVFGCFPSAMRHAALALALAHPHAHPQNEKEKKEREKEKQLYEGDCSASDIPGVWRQLQAPHVRAKATIFVQRAASRTTLYGVYQCHSWRVKSVSSGVHSPSEALCGCRPGWTYRFRRL